MNRREDRSKPIPLNSTLRPVLREQHTNEARVASVKPAAELARRGVRRPSPRGRGDIDTTLDKAVLPPPPPTFQLTLSEETLEEQVPRQLTAELPYQSKQRVTYSFAARQFVNLPPLSPCLRLLSLPAELSYVPAAKPAGSIIAEGDEEGGEPGDSDDDGHSDSDDGKGDGARVAENAPLRKPSHVQLPKLNLASILDSSQALAPTLTGVKPSLRIPAAAQLLPKPTAPPPRDRFVSLERSTQTAEGARWTQGTQVALRGQSTASGSCSRSIICDAARGKGARLANLEAEAAAKRVQGDRRASGKAAPAHGPPPLEALLHLADDDSAIVPVATPHFKSAEPSTLVVERMLMQSQLREIAMDFKYWDDPSDSVRTKEGTLLPLWRFDSPNGTHRPVRALAWHPVYPDLFAAAHGGRDPARPLAGLVALHSLRGALRPEAQAALLSAAADVCWSSGGGELLAVGCADGSLLVFDVREALRSGGGEWKPRLKGGGGEAGPAVVQIAWRPPAGMRQRLCVAYEDGDVVFWGLTPDALVLETRMTLKMPPPRQLVDADEEEDWVAVEPSRMEFQPGDLFLVGTAQGTICRCFTAHTARHLQAYSSHMLPVTAVSCNPMHEQTFLSASSDWSIRVWSATDSLPLLTLDCGSAIEDAAWLPRSSTAFGAITNNGRFYFVDLEANPYAPLCVQKLATRTVLTRLAFHPTFPVVLVGDDRGEVTCLKLSPNLRASIQAPPKAADPARTAAPERVASSIRGFAPSAAAGPAKADAAKAAAKDPVQTLLSILRGAAEDRERMMRHGLYLD